ncbi:MAG TPA: hypothetical protein VFA52_01270 [Candidatus Paceibacterota bacterium]|nr:hypothetical protein [Candidatus Paceibacterota bacterium]
MANKHESKRASKKHRGRTIPGCPCGKEEGCGFCQVKGPIPKWSGDIAPETETDKSASSDGLLIGKPHDDPECSCSECLEWVVSKSDLSREAANRSAEYDRRAEQALEEGLRKIP